MSGAFISGNAAAKDDQRGLSRPGLARLPYAKGTCSCTGHSSDFFAGWAAAAIGMLGAGVLADGLALDSQPRVRIHRPFGNTSLAYRTPFKIAPLSLATPHFHIVEKGLIAHFKNDMQTYSNLVLDVIYKPNEGLDENAEAPAKFVLER